MSLCSSGWAHRSAAISEPRGPAAHCRRRGAVAPVQRPRRGLHGGGRRELGLQATAAPAGMLWPCLGLLRGKPGAARRRGCGPTSMRLSASSYPPLCPCSRSRSGASTPAGEPRSPVRTRHRASRRSDRTSPQLAVASSPGTTVAPSPSPSCPVSHAAPPSLSRTLAEAGSAAGH